MKNSIERQTEAGFANGHGAWVGAFDERGSPAGDGLQASFRYARSWNLLPDFLYLVVGIHRRVPVPGSGTSRPAVSPMSLGLSETFSDPGRGPQLAAGSETKANVRTDLCCATSGRRGCFRKTGALPHHLGVRGNFACIVRGGCVVAPFIALPRFLRGSFSMKGHMGWMQLRCCRESTLSSFQTTADAKL